MAMSPYDETGVVTRGGIRRYSGLPPTLPDLLEARAQAHPDRVALIAPGEPELRYGDLLTRARRVAGGLQAAGCERGDRVALRLPNSLEWVTAYWGIQLAGCVVVPVGRNSAPAEVDYVRTDSAARLCIDDFALPDGECFVRGELTGDDLASLFYTSGTTGRPKGAMITQDNATQNAETTRRLYSSALGDHEVRSLIAVPLSHITGCNSQMVSTIHSGGTSVVVSSFAVDTFTEAIRKYAITVCVGVPTIFWRVLEDPGFDAADFSTVRALCYGGAPTPAELVRRIKNSFGQAKVQNAFGSTECTGLHTALPDAYAVTHSNSVGIPMPISEVRIDDEDDEGVGEIQVRGANICAGYWRRPAETEEAFTADGWFRIGDLGRIEDGRFLVVVDRIKDVIIRGGHKVFSGEVESVLAGASGVAEVAVVGVPDEEFGERVGAAITPSAGTNLDIGELVSFAEHHLSGYKIPELFHISPEPLLRNAGGKIVKAQIKAGIDWSDPEVVRRRPR